MASLCISHICVHALSEASTVSKHLGPIASYLFVHTPPVSEESFCLARSFHGDLKHWMNMYKFNNIIFLMVIGLMPACSSQKQMVITLPGSRCLDTAPLLNMTTTINTLIIYRQK